MEHANLIGWLIRPTSSFMSMAPRRAADVTQEIGIVGDVTVTRAVQVRVSGRDAGRARSPANVARWASAPTRSKKPRCSASISRVWSPDCSARAQGGIAQQSSRSANRVRKPHVRGASGRSRAARQDRRRGIAPRRPARPVRHGMKSVPSGTRLPLRTISKSATASPFVSPSSSVSPAFHEKRSSPGVPVKGSGPI